MKISEMCKEDLENLLVEASENIKKCTNFKFKAKKIYIDKKTAIDSLGMEPEDFNQEEE